MNWKNIKKQTTTTLKGIALGLEATLLPYLMFTSTFGVQREIEKYNLSPERQIIKQEYNVTILGENHPLPEGTLEFFERSPVEKPTVLKITPKEIYKQPLIIQGRQIAKLFGKSFKGMYNKYSSVVHLDTLTLDNIVHEFTHAKGFAADKADDTFIEKWAAISGKEHYTTLNENIFGYIISQEKDTLLLENGFTNQYAKTNVHEDLCELKELFEVKFHEKDWKTILTLYTNPFFQKKIHLLTEQCMFDTTDLYFAAFANKHTWVANELESPSTQKNLTKREKEIHKFMHIFPESKHNYTIQKINFLSHMSIKPLPQYGKPEFLRQFRFDYQKKNLSYLFPLLESAQTRTQMIDLMHFLDKHYPPAMYKHDNQKRLRAVFEHNKELHLLPKDSLKSYVNQSVNELYEIGMHTSR